MFFLKKNLNKAYVHRMEHYIVIKTHATKNTWKNIPYK